jgi:antitoxin MazE
MKTTIKKIGNSKGLIIPAQILKEWGFGDEVEIGVKDGAIIISSASRPRAGWAAGFAGAGAEKPLLPDNPTAFDRDEWTW